MKATRYAAFLRGVSPMNAKMPELAKAFEAAGFKDVKTLLSSGNVVFTASGSQAIIVRKAEAAMKKRLGRSFTMLVRSVDALREILQSDPFSKFRLARGSKRIVTFRPEKPKNRPALPIELDGARILACMDTEVFSAYVPGPKGPVFMTLIEKTFGKNVTSRSWETVKKAAR